MNTGNPIPTMVITVKNQMYKNVRRSIPIIRRKVDGVRLKVLAQSELM